MQSDKISPRGKFASIENYFHDFSLNLYYANTWGVAKNGGAHRAFQSTRLEGQTIVELNRRKN